MTTAAQYCYVKYIHSYHDNSNISHFFTPQADTEQVVAPVEEVPAEETGE